MDGAAQSRDSIVVELGVDLSTLATCDIFQVTVEIPYGAAFLPLNDDGTYFMIGDSYLRQMDKRAGNINISAITPYLKNERQMIVIVDHALSARTAGNARFATGKYKIGYFAVDGRMLGESDKYRIRVVAGKNYSVYATGVGSNTIGPGEDIEMRVHVYNDGRVE